MKKYSRTAMCIKCGHKDASTTYTQGYNSTSSSGFGGSLLTYVPEALQRVCPRCGYCWKELTLDSEEKDNG